jgi:hypothetical protein
MRLSGFLISRLLQLTLLTLPMSARCQDIDLRTWRFIHIDDNAPPDAFQLTDFGKVSPFDYPSPRTFIIANTDTSAPLDINFITPATNPCFSVSAPYLARSVPPGDWTSFEVFFTPLTAYPGDQTEQLIISTNDPDSEGEFQVNLKATVAPQDHPELYPDLKLTLPVWPRFKLNRKTGLVNVRVKLQASNIGKTTVTSSTLSFYASTSATISLPAQPIHSVALKQLPAAGPYGVMLMNVKTKFKIRGFQRVWAVLDYGGPDADFENNTYLTYP